MSVRKLQNLPQNLKSEEVRFLAKGQFTASSSEETEPALASLRARHEEADYRKAEALAREASDSLQLLKSLLARGLLEEAGQLLPRLHIMADAQLRGEVLLQEARYHYLRGDWVSSVTACNLAEADPELSALSKMVLFQIRSNAFFELSEFAKSFADYRKVESFETLFPHGQLPLYAHANRVRLQTRMLGLQVGVSEEKLLWSRWRTSLPNGNLDPVLTLLRSRIDLFREEGRDYGDIALASYLVAKSLGDELYEGLACLDIFAAGFPATRGTEWEARLEAYAETHLRVRQLRDEVFATADRNRCATAESMYRYIRSRRQEKSASPDFLRESAGVQRLLFTAGRIKVELPSKKVVPLDVTPQTVAALDALRAGAVEKAEFFSTLWRIGTFVPERHDAAIRTALRRVSQQTGVRIRSQQQLLSIPADVLILGV